MTEIALIALIVAFIADGIATAIAMDHGFQEVGRVARKLFGSRISDRGILKYHSAKIVGALLLYAILPETLAFYIFIGLAAPSFFAAGRNLWRVYG